MKIPIKIMAQRGAICALCWMLTLIVFVLFCQFIARMIGYDPSEVKDGISMGAAIFGMLSSGLWLTIGVMWITGEIGNE